MKKEHMNKEIPLTVSAAVVENFQAIPEQQEVEGRWLVQTKIKFNPKVAKEEGSRWLRWRAVGRLGLELAGLKVKGEDELGSGSGR
ncbi:hypothetical protein BY996DRAFT_6613566 [Phakopsora pachyrhizi]|nr:hypothetical protein BY996DRAFT_6613566 [Phakopsora pachyrhizi]